MELKKIIKYLLILIFSISVFFNVRNMLSVDNTKYDKLKADNKRLSLIRDSLNKINNELDKEKLIIQKRIDERDSLIKSLNTDLKKSDEKIEELGSKIGRMNEEKKKAEEKIKELMKNPIRRDDDELINSLKNKLTK